MLRGALDFPVFDGGVVGLGAAVLAGNGDGQDDVAALEQIAVVQLALDLADADAVEEGAVGAAQVTNDPALFRR